MGKIRDKLLGLSNEGDDRTSNKNLIESLQKEIERLESRDRLTKKHVKADSFIQSLEYLDGSCGVRIRRILVTRDNPYHFDEIDRFGCIPPHELAVLGFDRRLKNSSTERLLFLDTETTGLAGGSGTVAFLIGVGRFVKDGFYIEQLFLENLKDERDQLLYLEALLEESHGLVTFNGKSFDISSILKNRSIMILGEDIFSDIPHLDLLHAARRLYRDNYESLTLKSLELSLFGFVRSGDVDSSEVPQIYRNFLFAGRDPRLETVFEHNLLDILSMVRICYRMYETISEPWKHHSDACRLRVARMRGRMGDIKREISLLEELKDSPDTDVSLKAFLKIAKFHKKNGRIDLAVSILKECVDRHQHQIEPYIELAKLYEHHFKDYEKALIYAKEAQRCCQDFILELEIDHRIERLLKKLSRK